MRMLDAQTSEEDRPKWYVNVITAIVSILIISIFWRFGGPDAALSAAACLIANILVISFRWNQRKIPWFWAVIGIMLVIQFSLAIAIHWPHNSATRLVLFVVVVANTLVTFCVVRIVEKLRS
jgi:O-antigen/teichoic acid export membrane protein